MFNAIHFRHKTQSSGPAIISYPEGLLVDQILTLFRTVVRPLCQRETDVDGHGNVEREPLTAKDKMFVSKSGRLLDRCDEAIKLMRSTLEQERPQENAEGMHHGFTAQALRNAWANWVDDIPEVDLRDFGPTAMDHSRQVTELVYLNTKEGKTARVVNSVLTHVLPSITGATSSAAASRDETDVSGNSDEDSDPPSDAEPAPKRRRNAKFVKRQASSAAKDIRDSEDNDGQDEDEGLSDNDNDTDNHDKLNMAELIPASTSDPAAYPKGGVSKAQREFLIDSFTPGRKGMGSVQKPDCDRLAAKDPRFKALYDALALRYLRMDIAKTAKLPPDAEKPKGSKNEGDPVDLSHYTRARKTFYEILNTYYKKNSK